jgi:hypothetical protein
MDLTRFEALADAYGADLRRWPAAERDAADALMAAEPQAARALLSAAEGLDDLLAASRPPAPSPALRAGILAAAPRERRRRSGFGLWLQGAGLATAAMVGVVVGASALTAMTADARADAVLAEVLPDDGLDGLPLTVSAAPDGDFA